MRKIAGVALLLMLSANVFAQVEEREPTQVEKLEQQTEDLNKRLKVLEKVKISGYVQAQFQWGQEQSVLRVGHAKNESETSYSRIGIRRGRLKVTASDTYGEGVFEVDINDGGIKVKHAYAGIHDAQKIASFRLGVFDRCFGYELLYSSSSLESLERTKVVNALMPDEKDLGMELQLQAPKEHPLNFLKLQAGLYSGSGIGKDPDSYKDFIGRLSANKTIGSDMQWGAGISYYNGRVFQPKANYYSMSGTSFVKDTCAVGDYAKREYFGADAQFSFHNPLGRTTLRVEGIMGQQPGVKNSSVSNKDGNNFATELYLRPFIGGYAMLVHDIVGTKFAGVLKYDYYDQNTSVKGNELGLGDTTLADVAYTTFGFGVIYNFSKSLRLQTYVDLIFNEKSDNLAGFEGARKENFLTCRLQYKF